MSDWGRRVATDDDRTAERADRLTTSVKVNGLDTEAVFDPHLLDHVLIPSVADASTDGRRCLVFLVGPPGVGKSTLAAVLVSRAHQAEPPLDLDAVGIDGFHLPHAVLERRGLAERKGAPETFDVTALARALDNAREGDVVWPGYDRNTHDVVPAAHWVSSPVLVVEGTWLLLDEPGWADLRRHADLTIFIDAREHQLRERLVARKVAGGLARDEAEQFYERSDRVNVRRVLERSDRSAVDLVLHLADDDTLTKG
jgi:pantothenate kinase